MIEFIIALPLLDDDADDDDGCVLLPLLLLLCELLLLLLLLLVLLRVMLGFLYMSICKPSRAADELSGLCCSMYKFVMLFGDRRPPPPPPPP